MLSNCDNTKIKRVKIFFNIYTLNNTFEHVNKELSTTSKR